MDQLRRLSARKAALSGAALIAAAAVLFFVFGCQNLFLMFSPRSLADLTLENIEGAYVEDDIYLLYGSYLEEERIREGQRSGTGTITGIQYAIALNDQNLAGMFVHNTDLDRARALMDASDAFFEGELSPEALPVMHVKGTMVKMDGQEQRFYYGAVEGGDEMALREFMLPYYLDLGRAGGNDFWMMYFISGVSLVLAAIALFRLMKALTGGYQKQVSEKLRTIGGQFRVREELDRFYEETEPVAGVRMGPEFVLFQQGIRSILLRPWEVAWAYQQTTRHRTNGIPSGTSYGAVFRTMDGKTYNLGMKNEAAVQGFLAAMREKLPGTALGYSKELEQLYNNDRAAFAAHWEEACPGCTGRT